MNPSLDMEDPSFDISLYDLKGNFENKTKANALFFVCLFVLLIFVFFCIFFSDTFLFQDVYNQLHYDTLVKIIKFHRKRIIWDFFLRTYLFFSVECDLKE